MEQLVLWGLGERSMKPWQNNKTQEMMRLKAWYRHHWLHEFNTWFLEFLNVWTERLTPFLVATGLSCILVSHQRLIEFWLIQWKTKYHGIFITDISAFCSFVALPDAFTSSYVFYIHVICLRHLIRNQENQHVFDLFSPSPMSCSRMCPGSYWSWAHAWDSPSRGGDSFTQIRPHVQTLPIGLLGWTEGEWMHWGLGGCSGISK